MINLHTNKYAIIAFEKPVASKEPM